MGVVSMKQLLEAGVHFGHQTRRWNPKMAKYIYIERNGIYIIDLQKTSKKLDEAYNFIKQISANGKNVLFVGTKKQASDSVRDESQRVGAHYVNARWLGGMLTNLKTIKYRIKRLEQLRIMESDGTFERLPKKEITKLKLEIERLEKFIGGIKNMTELPGALFIVDPKKEKIAVAEAKKLGIPIVAIVDTNCDPDEVDYVIPGNDDAIRSVKLISQVIANAIIEGHQGADCDNIQTQQTAIDSTHQAKNQVVGSNTTSETKIKNSTEKASKEKVSTNKPSNNNNSKPPKTKDFSQKATSKNDEIKVDKESTPKISEKSTVDKKVPAKDIKQIDESTNKKNDNKSETSEEKIGG